MLASSLLSTLHLFALGIGLPGVFLRGRALKRLGRGDESALQSVFLADAAWGVAALVWLATGLTRAFGSFEKGPGYYLHSGTFLIKMALFGAVFALEMYPMITFIRWRGLQAKKRPIDFSIVPRLVQLNHAELALTILIPFFASAMARSIGFTLL